MSGYVLSLAEVAAGGGGGGGGGDRHGERKERSG